LINYIEENYVFLKTFISKELPEIHVVEPEGTYLVWLDFRAYLRTAKEIQYFMRNQAEVALSEGSVFGAEGEGFVRINIACPRALLRQGLGYIRDACRKL
jgi:cysteine-S-conjugate beta-lyase